MASVLICGIYGKRPATDKPIDQKEQKKPRSGPRPIVDMIIHGNSKKQHRIRVLLDTGCSTPLISDRLVEREHLPCRPHELGIAIRNFTGELVPGAGQKCTEPILLQHRNHYSWEMFEVAPLKPGVDVFLPFWWIVKHVPQDG